MRVPVWFWLGFCICLCTPAGVGAQTPVGVEAIQWGLPSAGYDPGAADGLFGPRTRAAIRSWQSSRGARSTGHLDGPQVEASPRHGASSSPALAGATAAQAGGAQEPPVVPEERRLICLFKAGWPITLRYTREPAMPVMCFGHAYCSDDSDYAVACPANPPLPDGTYTCPGARTCAYEDNGIEIKLGVEVVNRPGRRSRR